MTPRYLLIVGDAGWQSAELVGRISSRSGLQLAFSSARITALVNPSCGCIAVEGVGCILGSLFRRHGLAEPLQSLTAAEAASLEASDGQTLLDAFWGGYVAAIASADRLRILRDPSGTFPCYYVKCAGFTVFASDAELLVKSGVAPVDIDVDEIGRQLYRAFVPATGTALRGIRELLAGFAVRLRREDNQEPCWSPWDHVDWSDQTADEAAERLARTIRQCVRAWASTQGRLVLSVSGGLDSSIIAACLAKAGADTLCLTMFSEDPGADERDYARLLCDQLGLPLIERSYRLEDIDITEPLATHLPRPRDRVQALAYERVHNAVAAENGADAFMTGSGGDHVFGYSQSAAPIADRYLAEGLGSGMLTSLLDVCHQTGCSLFDALRQAWRLAHGYRGYRVRPNPLFLHRDFTAGLGAAELDHAWLHAPPDAVPGKAAHIATILRAQPILEPIGSTQYSVLNPLMSQPIIEACLKVPTWEWRVRGRDRSLARDAFASDLPRAVLERRVKGTPGRFAARLLDHFREPIRERLLGGRLASHRIIDASAVEHVLANERPVPDLERVRILELVNVEAWIDHWAARRIASDARNRM